MQARRSGLVDDFDLQDLPGYAELGLNPGIDGTPVQSPKSGGHEAKNFDDIRQNGSQQPLERHLCVSNHDGHAPVCAFVGHPRWCS